MPRILLIDDDVALRGILSKALGYAGHHVIQASDGQQGLDLFHAAAPIDVVVTDLIMPGKEGVETILSLRNGGVKVPIIAISGGVTNAKLYLEIAGKMGARRVLPKPFTPQELAQTIDEVLTEKEA